MPDRPLLGCLPQFPPSRARNSSVRVRRTFLPHNCTPGCPQCGLDHGQYLYRCCPVWIVRLACTNSLAQRPAWAAVIWQGGRWLYLQNGRKRVLRHYTLQSWRGTQSPGTSQLPAEVGTLASNCWISGQRYTTLSLKTSLPPGLTGSWAA